MEINQEHNKLLSRNECRTVIAGIITPSNSAVREELAKKMNKSADLIVIKKIGQKYGKAESEITFYVYDSEQALKKVEKIKEKKDAQQAAPAK